MNQMFNPEIEELNQEVMEQFSQKIENAINVILRKHSKEDTTVELLTVVISISAQIANDIGVSFEEFVGMCGNFYEDFNESGGEEMIEEENTTDKKVLN